MFDRTPLCEPRPGGQGRNLPAPVPPPSPGRRPRAFQAVLFHGLLTACCAGCVAPPVPMGPAVLLSAHPNPSPDGAYTVSWAPVGGASRYRLHENGALRYEGPGLTVAVADRADGSYFYALTYCVVAFGIEACNFKGAEVTVTVSRSRGLEGDGDADAG